MSGHSIRRPRAPHPSWRLEWPPGCVVVGYTRTGKPIFIPPDMRSLGVEVIGLPGQGKSRAAEAMLRQDLLELDGIPRGAVLIDPHGTLYTNFLRWYVSHGLHRVRRIRVLDPSDPRHVFHLNTLRRRLGVDAAVIAAAVVNALLRVWRGDATATPQLRTTLKHTFFTLCELGLPLTEAANLLDLTDASGLRARAAAEVSNPVVRQFWRELDALRLAQREERVGSAQRRLVEFLLPERVRAIFGDAERALDWREVMDNGDFVIVNLAFDTGALSEDEAQVIGIMMLAEIFLACQGRPEGALPFYIYLDECHRFLTEDIAKVITEGRKFGVHAVLMHQVLAQLRDAGDFVFSAVMACRTKIVFGGLEPADAEHMAKSVFRGQFDLQRDKVRYRTPIVIGQELDWLLSESETEGSAEARGENWSEGGSHAEQQSRTVSRGITTSVSETRSSATTLSRGTTRGVSDSRSSGVTRNSAVTQGESDTDSSATTDSSGRTRSSGHTDTRGSGTTWSTTASSQTGESHSRSQLVDDEDDDEPLGLPRDTDTSSQGQGSASSRGGSSQRGGADSYGEAHTVGSAATTGRAHSRSIAQTQGSATTEGQAHTTSIAQSEGTSSTTGRAVTTSTAISKSVADTAGTTDTVSWSEGGSHTRTDSEARSQGRSQTLRSVYEVRPQQAYTLDELIHMASVTIANLKQGEAIIKIGRRPSSRVQIVRVEDGWATPQHIDRVTAQLAAVTPCITPLLAQIGHGERSGPKLRVVRSDAPDPGKKPDAQASKPPAPPKNDPDDGGWG